MALNRKLVATLIMSSLSLAGIAMHEGFRPVAYIPVPGDVPTIGYGTTEGVKLGDTITVERAMHRLVGDVTKFEAAVRRCAPVPMFQYEFDAYVSLTYNIGETAFCNSTLAKYLNEYKYTEACYQVLRWDKFKGRALRGLTKRRYEEFNKCMGR